MAGPQARPYEAYLGPSPLRGDPDVSDHPPLIPSPMAIPPLPMPAAVPRHRHFLDAELFRLVGQDPPHIDMPLPPLGRREPHPLTDLRPYPITLPAKPHPPMPHHPHLGAVAGAP